MIELLRDKKVIFFDVGYTLEYPASGDWWFTNKFYELVANKFAKHRPEDIQKAKNISLEYLEKNHLVQSVEDEYFQFIHFYSEISRNLDLGLTEAEIKTIAYDRAYNMNNYIAYPDVKRVLSVLSWNLQTG